MFTVSFNSGSDIEKWGVFSELASAKSVDNLTMQMDISQLRKRTHTHTRKHFLLHIMDLQYLLFFVPLLYLHSWQTNE